MGINSVLAALMTSSIANASITLTNQETGEGPTGQGLTDQQTLESNGNTVNLDIS